jgi:hypothetical protein
MNKLAIFALAAVFAAGVSPAHAQSPTPAAAMMPTCASGDPVVWENTKSKKHVYHMSTDKYYGKSKAGKYVCESQAKTDGYHAAGAMGGGHHHMGMASPAPSPAAT